MVDEVAGPILKKAEEQEAQHLATISQADEALNAINAQTDYANELSKAKQVASNVADTHALNKRTVEMAENLQNQVMGVRKQLGSEYDVIDEAASAAGITPENRDVIGNLIEQLQTAPLQESQFNAIVKKLQPYLGKTDMESFRGLKGVLNDLGSKGDYQTRSLFRDAYSQLRNNYNEALIAGGKPELAQKWLK